MVPCTHSSVGTAYSYETDIHLPPAPTPCGSTDGLQQQQNEEAYSLTSASHVKPSATAVDEVARICTRTRPFHQYQPGFFLDRCRTVVFLAAFLSEVISKDKRSLACIFTATLGHGRGCLYLIFTQPRPCQDQQSKKRRKTSSLEFSFQPMKIWREKLYFSLCLPFLVSCQLLQGPTPCRSRRGACFGHRSWGALSLSFQSSREIPMAGSSSELLLIPVHGAIASSFSGVQAGWRLGTTTLFPEMVMGTNNRCASV